MSKSTRYFMAGSAAIMAVGLSIGLVSYYGGGFPGLQASTGPTELAYVPADSAVIAYADVQAIMNSELRQQLKAAMPTHALICGRSYGPSESRSFPIPGEREPDRFYLRQCSRATEANGPDRMLWRIPQIVRAALDPDGALAPTHDATKLQPGDVIALGTPGGITLTVRKRGLIRFLNRVFFWWNARDWHDAFFRNDVVIRRSRITICCFLSPMSTP